MSFRLNNGFGCVVLLGILIGPGLVAAHVLHSLAWAVMGPVVVVAVMLGVAALPLKRKVTSKEFADELERHLQGTDDDDWDRTSSVRIFNPLLEGVRRSLSDRFDSLSSPENREELRQIIETLRRGDFPSRQ
jgi:hypothetical protein